MYENFVYRKLTSKMLSTITSWGLSRYNSISTSWSKQVGLFCSTLNKIYNCSSDSIVCFLSYIPESSRNCLYKFESTGCDPELYWVLLNLKLNWKSKSSIRVRCEWKNHQTFLSWRSNQMEVCKQNCSLSTQVWCPRRENSQAWDKQRAPCTCRLEWYSWTHRRWIPSWSAWSLISAGQCRSLRGQLRLSSVRELSWASS